MIGSLRGTLLDRSLDGEVLVEVAGVGYRVTVAPDGLARVGEIGDEVFLWVHHHVREDAQTLYGFATREERVCFEALLGAHGVGPALALAILSVHGPGALREVIANQDVAALCLVPGRGQEDRGPAAGRAAVPPRPARHRPHAHATVARRRPARPAATSPRPWPAWATAPTRSGGWSTTCPPTASPPTCSARRCAASP